MRYRARQQNRSGTVGGEATWETVSGHALVSHGSYYSVCCKSMRMMCGNPYVPDGNFRVKSKREAHISSLFNRPDAQCWDTKGQEDWGGSFPLPQKKKNGSYADTRAPPSPR